MTQPTLGMEQLRSMVLILNTRSCGCAKRAPDIFIYFLVLKDLSTC